MREEISKTAKERNWRIGERRERREEEKKGKGREEKKGLRLFPSSGLTDCCLLAVFLSLPGPTERGRSNTIKKKKNKKEELAGLKRARSTATTIVSRVIISGKCLVASMIGYAAILLEILFLPLPESLGLTDLSSCAVREKSTEGRGENIATDVLSNSWCIIFIIFTPYILLHCVSCYHRQLRSMLRLNICSQEFQPPGQRRPSVWLVPESNQKNQKKKS